MFYLKHRRLGNKHVETEAEAVALEAEGFVRWPRTKEQKAVTPEQEARAEREQAQAEKAERERLIKENEQLRNQARTNKPA